MKCTIITIGDELLNGQTVDTNGAWLGRELNDIGVDVIQRFTIADEHNEIIRFLSKASKESSLIIMTGGLGPTKDDVTKKAIADFVDDELVFNEENYAHIKELFSRLGREPTELHRQQAYLPTSTQQIKNQRGTAPGIWIEKNGLTLLAMPGVPSEMKGIMTNGGLERIQSRNQDYHIIHYVIRTAGIGETNIAAKIEDILLELPNYISLAYLPSFASVKVRLTAKGKDRGRLEREVQEFGSRIKDRISKWTYAIGKKELPEVIGELCKEKGLSIGTAESCTGGHIAHLITQIPGSSAYFEGSIVSYSNDIKKKVLGVSEATLQNDGAVSEATVKQMVSGAISQLGVDVAVAVSGIAGPGGGSETKPVGTVWIAVGDKDQVVTKKWKFAKDRLLNINYSSIVALNMLRLFILGESPE